MDARSVGVMISRSIALSLAPLAALGILVNACANGGPNDAAAYGDEITTKSATEPKDSGTKKSSSKPSTTTTDDDDDTTTKTDDVGDDDDTTVADGGTSSPTDSGASVPKDSGVSTPACAKAAPSNVCGISPQCGCAAGETCDVTNKTTGASACVKAGSGVAGAACTTTSGCKPGLTCNNGTCLEYCGAGNTCATGTCLSVNNSSGSAIPNLNVCSVTCDLMNPKSTCGSGGCGHLGSGLTTCQKAGTGTSDDYCTSASDCSSGMLCIDDGYDTMCEKWCRIGKSDCPLGWSCTALANPPVIGGVTYGFCY